MVDPLPPGQRYDPLHDLLRSRQRARAGRRRWVLTSFAAAVMALVAWLALRGPSASVPEVEENAEVAVAAAQGVVSGSVFAAQEPLRVEAPAAAVEDALGLEREAATRSWSEGLATRLEGTIKPGQSISVSLGGRGIPHASIHAAVTAMGEQFDFRTSRPGDSWVVELNGEGGITSFEYATSPESIWRATRSADGAYEVSKKEVAVETRHEVVQGTIESSLWIAFEAAGASPKVIAQYMDMFAYTVDFNGETKAGDRFVAVYEKVYLDGEFLRDGRMVAAKYEGEVGTYYGFYHSDGEGGGSYFDENGDNLRRQFLKSPLPIVRITSNFGRRFHPVLGKMKMHAGVDYGAPTGTPVMAAADGTVTHAGWKGANGKLVSIRHANGYVTHYAHLSAIEKGIKKGVRVKQKQRIGRVGSTGRSTGPHLHYGMKKNGQNINPLKVDSARAEPLKGAERERFLREVVAALKGQLG